MVCIDKSNTYLSLALWLPMINFLSQVFFPFLVYILSHPILTYNYLHGRAHKATNPYNKFLCLARNSLRISWEFCWEKALRAAPSHTTGTSWKMRLDAIRSPNDCSATRHAFDIRKIPRRIMTTIIFRAEE